MKKNLTILTMSLLLMLTMATSLQAQETINVMAHAVHMDVAVGADGAGIDLTPDFEETTGMTVRWDTLPWGEMESLVYREATLSNTDYSIIFILDAWLTNDMLNLFMPLNEYLDNDPLDDFDSIAAGMRESLTKDGNLYGIPYRGNSTLFFYNQEVLEAHGYEQEPQSFEEVLEIAKAVSGRRDDGARVYGIRLQVDEFVNWARAWNGDAVTEDYQIAMTEEPMIKALYAARELYEAGAIPPNFMNMTADDYLTYFQNGQLAMSIRGASYYMTLNNPDESVVAGNLGYCPLPASAEVDIDVAPIKVDFWSMAIPNAAVDKDKGWEFIKYFATEEAALTMALNGSGPTVLDVYENEQYIDEVPYAEEAKIALNNGRPLWPAFDGVTRAKEIFEEEVVRAILGMKTPEEAMADAAAQIEPLLP